ncbi:hypothetical protein [Pseudomonas caspiana]|uniref:hypothetical protein n=1 Tax=Pseudomonas caspiana TaxID=1451454 RepID=UPI0032EB599B
MHEIGDMSCAIGAASADQWSKLTVTILVGGATLLTDKPSSVVVKTPESIGQNGNFKVSPSSKKNTFMT